MVQPFVLEILISSFEKYPSWKNAIPKRWYFFFQEIPRRGIITSMVFTPREGGRPPTKAKILYSLNISFLKYNFKLIGFHRISFSTFIKKILPYTAMLRNSNSFRSFQSRTLKNNRFIISNISDILKPKRSFYDDLFKRYRLHRLTN